jgi:glycosyltransferase involved in cell wall biosynthesis
MIVSNDMLHDSRVDRHANALGMAGHEVFVICFASALNQDKRERREHYSILRFHSRRTLVARKVLHAHSNGTLSSKIRQAIVVVSLIVPARLALYARALRTGAHVCYCNDLDTLDVGIMMKLIGKSVVYDSHELYSEMMPVGPRRRLSALFERMFINIADVLITVNPFIASELRRRYNIKKRIHVVLNCPDAQIRPPSSQAQLKRVTVLYHGGLDADRGLENLVRASRNFYDNIRLVIRGEGKLESQLKQLAFGRSNVIFEKTVPMNEVVQAATEADIGVIPYLATNLNQYYCSPNKLFEYIQAGLVVVTSNLPFLRQTVMENRIGQVFDPQDPTDIARKINFVSEKTNLSNFKRNVKHARQRYTWEEEKEKLYVACRSLKS